MTDALALTRLYDAVQDRFQSEGTPVSMAFGWRKPNEKLLSGWTIIWEPGDPGGGIGDIAPPRSPGRRPNRPLGTLLERCTVYIQARDAAAPEDERLQYETTRRLFDAWYRAVYLAAYGTFEIQSNEWVTKDDGTGQGRSLRRAGAAIKVVLIIQAALMDETLETVTATDAEVDVTELDVTEVVTV